MKRTAQTKIDFKPLKAQRLHNFTKTRSQCVREATRLVRDVCSIVLEYDACFHGVLETTIDTAAHVDSVVQLANGTFAMIFDNRVEIWDENLASKLRILAHKPSRRIFAAVAVPQSAQLALLSYRSMVTVWNTEVNFVLNKFNSNIGPFSDMRGMVCLPSGILVVNQHAELIARTTSGELVGAMTQDRGGVTSVVALSNGMVAFGTWTMVRTWDTRQGTQTLGHHSGHVSIVAGLPNNKLASCCELSELFIWDVANASRLRCCTTCVYAMAHSLNGDLITINLDRTIKGWSTATGECIATIKYRYTTQRFGLISLANGSVLYHYENAIYIYN